MLGTVTAFPATNDMETVIGVHAARLVGDDATIFLDASRASLALARQLASEPRVNLTVVTNSPAVACAMECLPTQVIVCPGKVEPREGIIGGPLAVRFIHRLHFDVVFVSAAGVCLQRGLTATSIGVRDVLDAARSRAPHSIGLIGSAWFDRAYSVPLGAVGQLDAIITDPELPASVARRYRSAGVRLDIAPMWPLRSDDAGRLARGY